MDLHLSPDQLAFREEVRGFVAASYPAELRGKRDFAREDYLRWHRILAARGWSAPSWPVEHGGPPWGPVERHLYAEEMARANTVPPLPAIGMIGPALFQYGTTEQQHRFIAPTRLGDIWWCQGYSEPGAGSDLAALAAKAVREGDHYVVTGQKTWTTLGHFANWGFFLVRTANDGPRQHGITFLLIDMASPGLTIRPIITMDGSHEVNEVWLDEVRVPVANRIGEEDRGWEVAKYILGFERFGIAGISRSKGAAERLKAAADATREWRDPADENVLWQRIAEVEVELLALEYTELRMLSDDAAGRPVGAAASLLKIKGSEIRQRITELGIDAGGPGVIARGADGAGPGVGTAQLYFLDRKVSIYGGSNEIQRNLIARELGLLES